MKTTIKALLIIVAMFVIPSAKAIGVNQCIVSPGPTFTWGGNINGAAPGSLPSGTTNCVTIDLPSTAAVITLGATGTWSATLAVEESQDNGLSYTSAGTSITTNGTTSYVVAGFTQFRVRATAYTSGVANINLQVSAAPSGGVTSGTADPTGTACSPNALYVQTTTGNLYSCNTGVFAIVSGAGGSPGGNNTDIQFNDSSAFGGNDNFIFDKTTLSLTLNGGANSFDLISAGPSQLNAIGVDGTGGGGITIAASEPGADAIEIEAGAAGILMTATGNGVTFGGVGISTPLHIAGSTSGTCSLTASATSTSLTSSCPLPAGNIAAMQSCGTTTTCSHTAISSNATIVFGSAALVSGTPSTYTVTGISPAFTSSTSYVCTLAGQSAATTSLYSVANVSGSSFTVTGPSTVSTVVNYICVGN